jgi:hypothetical protein
MVPLKFAKIKCVKVCPAHPPECRVGVENRVREVGCFSQFVINVKCLYLCV